MNPRTGACHDGSICDATIRSFPYHPFAYNIKAALATAKGLQDDALKFLEIAHSKAPNDPLILLNLGDSYMRSGKTADARKAYAKVLELDAIVDSLKQQAREAISESNKMEVDNRLPAPSQNDPRNYNH